MRQASTDVGSPNGSPTSTATSWLFGPKQLVTDVPVSGPVLVGAHRGAGLTTLVTLDGTWSAESRWLIGDQRPVVVVCRSHAAGLIAAGRLLDVHRDIPPLGVLVVADAPGHLPVALQRRLRLLAGVAPQVWRLPWVEAWRRRPVAGPAPPAVRKVLDQVLASADLHRLSMGA